MICDLTTESAPLRAQGFDAVVNLVGIKRELGTQSFEAVHVDVTRRLLDVARAEGIRRFVQVSVVCSRPDPASAYHDTKWRAEELVRGSGLDATILRPAVIYGPGDDMITHLVRMLRFAPPFPIVGRGESVLQPVDVRDVARAVALALEQPAAGVRCFDVVSPTRLTLREVVQTVADGMGVRVGIVPVPLPLQRLAVGIMNRLSDQPLATPAQLRMLAEGLSGDPELARRDLGLAPRPFTADAVRAVEASIPSLFGWSLRLAPSRSHGEWLRSLRPLAPRAALVALLAAVLPLALAPWRFGAWARLGVAYAVLIPVALGLVRLPWARLFRPSGRLVKAGVSAAIVLYLCGWIVWWAIGHEPGLASQARGVYSWKDQIDRSWAPPLLSFIVLGEEILRNAVTLPFAARLGPFRGSLLAALLFAAAHVWLGAPVLTLAAFAAGLFWSLLIVRVRSAVPALVCHALWDLLLLFLLPYPGLGG